MSKKKLGLYALLISFVSVLFIGLNTNVAKAQTVNDYIISNKIQPATIQNREGTFTDWTPYENGVGKPEGVVIHETADNNATAENEVSFFNNNWTWLYTYVHAFADDNEIINIHNTDYAVWGAGPTANAKFVQIELCRTHSYNAFAKSIANQAFYAATKLIQYNLPDTPGVTVMSHHQTTLKWHETTHVDPDTYFPTWGYSMDQMNDMIGYYYNNLKNTGAVYGGNGTNVPTTNGSNTITVNNAGGDYVPLVAFNNAGVAVTVQNRALANNTPWYTDQTKDFNGVTYHRVATNEWVAANYIK